MSPDHPLAPTRLSNMGLRVHIRHSASHVSCVKLRTRTYLKRWRPYATVFDVFTNEEETLPVDRSGALQRVVVRQPPSAVSST